MGLVLLLFGLARKSILVMRVLSVGKYTCSFIVITNTTLHQQHRRRHRRRHRHRHRHLTTIASSSS